MRRADLIAHVRHIVFSQVTMDNAVTVSDFVGGRDTSEEATDAIEILTEMMCERAMLSVDVTKASRRELLDETLVWARARVANQIVGAFSDASIGRVHS